MFLSKILGCQIINRLSIAILLFLAVPVLFLVDLTDESQIVPAVSRLVCAMLHWT